MCARLDVPSLNIGPNKWWFAFDRSRVIGGELQANLAGMERLLKISATTLAWILILSRPSFGLGLHGKHGIYRCHANLFHDNR